MSDLERIVREALTAEPLNFEGLIDNEWREIVAALRAANVTVVGRCRDCSAYQVNGDWAWCGEDNLSSQNANAPLSPDGYCSDYEPRAKTEDDK